MKLGKLLKAAALVLCGAAVTIGAVGAGVSISRRSTAGSYETLPQGTQKSFATTFSAVKKNPKNRTQGRAWRDGMIGGDGKLGFVNAGAPYDDTLIFQDVDYIMPSSRQRDAFPDLSGELEKTRQAILAFDDSYTVAECGEWNWGYAFHPGQTLRLTQTPQRFHDYVRWTDWETGEVGVRYTDKNGRWTRTTFTSRKDHVTITALRASDTGTPLHLSLTIDSPQAGYKFGSGDEKNMQWKVIAADDASALSFVAHYPAYEGSPLKNGGYAGVTYVLTEGGSKTKDGDAIVISGADAVYLISENDRTTALCGESDSADASMEVFASRNSFALTDALLAHCRAVAESYSSGGVFDYAAALAPSAEEHGALFRASSLSLCDDEDAAHLSNEALLKQQKRSGTLSLALLERFYGQARHAMICSAGYTMSRLSGMWTGEWMPGWRSEYTMDANVNLQSAGMNTSNLPLFGEGYIKFILRQVEDWKTNAKQNYGFTDALKAPVNADGDGALDTEYAQSYPFQYWNAGASWMIQPIYEYYLCFGNRELTGDNGERLRVLDDVLLPLLQMQAHFWEQLCTPEYYTDKDGNACYLAGKTSLEADERYLIIPSYSPENTTGGAYRSTLAVNAAMDIGAAKSGLQMTIAVETATKTDGWQTRVERWQALLEKLPDYQFDETGAIREWCANGYDDNNKHRHISHLYCAWPLLETQHDAALAAAALQAIDNREKENSASHGFVHQALVLARLRQGERVEGLLHDLLKSRLCYTSMMTDHNTNRGSDTYCTDSLFGCVGVVNEMLLCSDEQELRLLPALPQDWTQGTAENLAARTNASVSLHWQDGAVTATITSQKAQTIAVSCGGGKAQNVTFAAGETKTLQFAL